MESATRIFEALAEDFRWTLLTNRGTPRTERWRAGGARIMRFAFDDDASRVVRGAQLAAASAKALAIAATIGPAILHANDIRGAQILMPTARVMPKPMALTLRDTKPPEEPYRQHWRRVTRRLNRIITLSDEMALHVAKRLPVPHEYQRTIHSIVDLDSFRPREGSERDALRTRLGIGAGELALGLVAGFVEKKRQLEVIQHLMPKLEELPLRLHLVGDFAPASDPYAKACAAAVEAGGLSERVIFHGFRSDVADWLAALDIVIVASSREGLARCMIEAMASGTPVVSFDVCSAQEMLETTGAGIVCPLDDWSAMAEGVRLLAADSVQRRAMGQVGRSTAEQTFSEDTVAEAWYDFYSELVSQSKKLGHKS